MLNVDRDRIKAMADLISDEYETLSAKVKESVPASVKQRIYEEKTRPHKFGSTYGVLLTLLDSLGMDIEVVYVLPLSLNQLRAMRKCRP